MKKDIELYRKILKVLEDNDEEYFHIAYDKPMQIKGYENKEVVYNLKLMFDDELIKGQHKFDGLAVIEVSAKPTSQGHDFIKVTKDEGLWNSFKEQVGPQIQSIPLTVMISLLKDWTTVYFKNKLGI